MREEELKEWLDKRGYSDKGFLQILRDRVIRLLQKEAGLPNIIWTIEDKKDENKFSYLTLTELIS